MIVLDTNVISEVVRPVPAQSVLQWLDVQRAAEVVTTAITAAELRAGVAVMPDGRRRQEIGFSIERLLTQTFDDLVIPFAVDCTPAYAQIMAGRKAAGQRMTSADAQIAAICLTRGATLVTRNTKDFEGIDLLLIDHWRA